MTDAGYKDVEIEDGRYAVRLHDSGRVEVRIHGGDWTKPAKGDLIQALAWEILTLREVVEIHENE